jgi:hypothetical protein
MVINILGGRIRRRIAPDVRTPLSLIHAHIVKPQLCGEYHRRQVDGLPIGCYIVSPQSVVLEKPPARLTRNSQIKYNRHWFLRNQPLPDLTPSGTRIRRHGASAQPVARRAIHLPCDEPILPIRRISPIFKACPQTSAHRVS